MSIVAVVHATCYAGVSLSGSPTMRPLQMATCEHLHGLLWVQARPKPLRATCRHWSVVEMEVRINRPATGKESDTLHLARSADAWVLFCRTDAHETSATRLDRKRRMEGPTVVRATLTLRGDGWWPRSTDGINSPAWLERWMPKEPCRSSRPSRSSLVLLHFASAEHSYSGSACSGSAVFPQCRGYPSFPNNTLRGAGASADDCQHGPPPLRDCEHPPSPAGAASLRWQCPPATLAKHWPVGVYVLPSLDLGFLGALRAHVPSRPVAVPRVAAGAAVAVRELASSTPRARLGTSYPSPAAWCPREPG
jgi:hypothetical protein